MIDVKGARLHLSGAHHKELLPLDVLVRDYREANGWSAQGAGLEGCGNNGSPKRPNRRWPRHGTKDTELPGETAKRVRSIACEADAWLGKEVIVRVREGNTAPGVRPIRGVTSEGEPARTCVPVIAGGIISSISLGSENEGGTIQVEPRVHCTEDLAHYVVHVAQCDGVSPVSIELLER